MFLDERGTGLRVTWHPERDLVVLSVWQEDSCVGTFRMLVQDVPRLSGLLAAVLGDWVEGGGLGRSAVTEAGPLDTTWPHGRSGASGSTWPHGGLGDPGAKWARGGPGAVGTPSATWAGGAPGAAGAPTAVGTPSAVGAGGAQGAVGTLGGERAGGVAGPGRVGAGLSVQQRLRLSRPVLRLRGLQQRRRRSA
jgi:hypothetical protein